MIAVVVYDILLTAAANYCVRLSALLAFKSQEITS